MFIVTSRVLIHEWWGKRHEVVQATVIGYTNEYAEYIH